MPEIDSIAAAIHETWRNLSRQQGWSMSPQLDRAFAELAGQDKEDNRAAARRMDEVLAKAGLTLSNDPNKPEADLPANLEAMAEAEPALIRAANRGIVHRNAARRKVSRLAHRIAKIAK